MTTEEKSGLTVTIKHHGGVDQIDGDGMVMVIWAGGNEEGKYKFYRYIRKATTIEVIAGLISALDHTLSTSSKVLEIVPDSDMGRDIAELKAALRKWR